MVSRFLSKLYSSLVFWLILILISFPASISAKTDDSSSLSVNSGYGSSTDTIIVRGDFNYPPYEYLDEGKPTGFNIELLQEVTKVMGLNIRISLGTWSTVRKQLETGKIDLISGMFYSKERDSLVDFSNPYITVTHAVFVRTNSDIKSLDDLHDMKVIVEKGDIMSDYAEKNYPIENLIYTDSQVGAVDLLSSGEGDAALLGRVHGLNLLYKMQIANVITAGPPIEAKKYCFAVKTGSNDLIQQLNEGLSIIQRTGRYEMIYNKWFGEYEEKSNLETLGEYTFYVLSILGALLILTFVWMYSLKRQVNRKTSELRNELEEKMRMELALKESEELYRKLLASIPDLVIRTDIKGNILYINDMISNYEWLGSKDELIGKNIYELVAPDDRERSLENLKLMFQKPLGIREYKVIINNKSAYFEVNGDVLRDHNGVPQGLVLLLREISERKKMLNDLVEAKEQAEKSDKFKSAFLAQISHEIRTPINTILSFSSLIKESYQGIVTGDIAFGFSSIRNAGKRIIRTIDLLLNMSAIQTGNYEIEFKKIEVSKIFKDIMDEFIPAAREKGLSLNLINQSGRDVITGDEYSISQIFINLVDNAIKYTHEGSVDIIVKTSDANLSVVIKDTGIGISKEFLPDLFSPFVQEDDGYTRKYEGNGLGLALVKKYCEMNNVMIEVRSEKGIGTEFEVIFDMS